jgi:hypothetical protein
MASESAAGMAREREIAHLATAGDDICNARLRVWQVPER